MAVMTIDLTNFKNRFGSRVPEGTYLTQIEDLESTTSKQGNPMIIVYSRIVGGEYDGANLVDRLTLSENAMFRVVAFLQGLGIKTPRKKIQVDENRIIGRKVMVDVADGEPYNGNVRSEIKAYSRYQESTSVSDDLDDLEEDVEEAEIVEEAPRKVKKKEKPVEDDDLDLDEIEL